MPGESNISGSTSIFQLRASETFVTPDGSVRSTVASASFTHDSFTLRRTGLPRLPGADSLDEEPRIASNNRSQNHNPLTRGMFGGLLGGGAGLGFAAIFGATPLAMLIIGLLLFALIFALMHSGGIHNHGIHNHEEEAHEHSESVRGHIVQPPAEGHTPSPVVTPLPVATPPPAITPPVNDDEFTLPIHVPPAPLPIFQAPMLAPIPAPLPPGTLRARPSL